MNDASEVTHLVSALNELDKKINKITSSMNKMKLSQTTTLIEKIRKQIASFDFSSLEKGVVKNILWYNKRVLGEVRYDKKVYAVL